MTDSLDDFSLIDRVLAGNAHAYGLLVQRYQTYAYTLALRVVKHEMVAEEVAQDAFVSAYKALDRFDRQAKFSTWLYRIVLNAALAQVRKKKMQFTAEMPLDLDDATDSASDLLTQERRAHLEKGMEQLSEGDRALLTLFYFKEQSLEEISEIVSQPANTVKVKIHRARARLAKAMEAHMQHEVHSLL